MVTARELLQALDGTAHQGGHEQGLTLDLSNLTFIDSRGIEALMKLKRLYGRLSLLSPTPPVRKVFEILQLGSMSGIEIHGP